MKRPNLAFALPDGGEFIAMTNYKNQLVITTTLGAYRVEIEVKKLLLIPIEPAPKKSTNTPL